MSAPVLIGDEVTAAGFRLAGMDTRVPDPHQAAEALTQARERAPLVLITAGLAQHIPGPQLDAALAAITPLVVVIPDLREQAPAPDLGGQWRGQLGSGP